MCDRDRGTTFHQNLDRFLNEPLGLTVDRRRRLVENQNGGIERESSTKRDELLLSDRESRTALAYFSIEPAFELVDESVGEDAAGTFDNALA